MISVLLIWFYISIVCYINGTILIELLRRLFKLDDVSKIDTPTIAITGLAFVTTVSGYLYFITNIGLLVNLLICAYSLIYFLINPHIINKKLFCLIDYNQIHSKWIKRLLSVTGWCFFSMILIRTTGEVRISDSGGYHIPLIKWMETYPIVPGLANLHSRFGLNSSWFLSNALFSFSFFKIQSFHVINGWIMLMFVLSFYKRTVRFIAGDKRLINYFSFGYLLFLIWFFHWQLSSPSPDLPSGILIGICCVLFLQKWEDQHTKGFTIYSLLILILSCYVVTIKISTLPILLLCAILIVLEIRFKSDLLVKLSIIGLIFVSYWLIGNVVLSGYLLYPSTAKVLDIFHYDWKVPEPIISLINKCVMCHARPANTFGEVFQNWNHWIPAWFNNLTIVEKLLSGLLLLLPFMNFLLLIAGNKKYVFLQQRDLILYVVIYSGVLFWFIASPAFRFGIGFIAAAIVLGLAPLLLMIKEKWNMKGYGSVVLVFLFSLLFLGASVYKKLPDLLLQQNYPTVKVYSYKLDGREMYYPADTTAFHGIKGFWSQCYDTDLPCSYYNKAIEFRGESLEDGFKVKKP